MADTQSPEDSIDPEIRKRLALALDVDDLVAAIRLGRELNDYFGVAKIGLELYSARQVPKPSARLPTSATRSSST